MKSNEQKHSRLAIFNTPVRSCLKEQATTVSDSTSCEKVVELMRDQQLSSVVVADDTSALVGIVTERDIVRKLTFQKEGNVSVSDIMGEPVEVIQEQELLYQAISVMRRCGFQHLPVVNQAGLVKGIIRLVDALQYANERVMHEVDVLACNNDIVQMKDSKQAQCILAQDLYDESLPGSEIQAVISSINGDLTRQVLDKVIDEMAEQFGPPPVRFAVIIMGSGGRGESFLHPDQDNGFILEDYPDSEHDQVDLWFRECANRFNIYLDEIGFPLCIGYIMARNPMWRKSISQWKEQIDLWVSRGYGNWLRYVDIFFDFDHCAGAHHLVEELRIYVANRAKNKKRFLIEMFRYDDTDVALGLFSRLITEKGEHNGLLNLKHRGLMPLVRYIRLLALKNGIAENATQQRINILHQQKQLSDDMRTKLRFAFDFISKLLLQHQLQQVRASQPVSNFVDPDALAQLERELLIKSFQAIEALRTELRAQLLGEYV